MITETASKVSSIALRRSVDLADVQAKKSFGAQMSYNCHSLEWHTCLFKEKTFSSVGKIRSLLKSNLTQKRAS